MPRASGVFSQGYHTDAFAKTSRKQQKRRKKMTEKIYISDAGSLLIRVGGTKISLPNGYGDGPHTFYDWGEISIKEAVNRAWRKWYDVATFDGEFSVESYDCGGGRDIYHSDGGRVVLYCNRQGDFAVSRVIEK